ncbi:MAG: hypothetical protein IT328_04310 [Caldilineaceae bacterium]|nr:hypothetical protein [Caldilineaceae bacterium]
MPPAAAAQGTPADLTPIAVIQGAGPASPFDGQEVATWGLVTGVASDGFYLQDPTGDGDMHTSDGLFVYSWSAPTVTAGQCVRVTGEVVEYFAKTELNWLTAITPTTECGAEQVTPVALPLVRPGDDPVQVLEALEGMVVRLDALEATVHGPTKRFASGEQEMALLPEPWPRYVGAGHLFHDQPALSSLLYLSNRLGATLPNARWGDTVQVGAGGLVGVLDYNFGKYQLLPWAGQALMATAAEIEKITLPAVRPDEYGVCSLNVHGLGQGEAQFPDPAGYAAALRQRAEVIATELVGCTVVALQETGSPADAQALAEVLGTEFGLAYTSLAIEGPASGEAEFPLTNSLLVDSARVTVQLADAVEGCAAQDYGIVAPGVCPLGEYPVFDRPPLMAQLLIAGPQEAPWEKAQTLWVINNHWKSKSGDENANARLRAAQAAVVAQRVQAILSVDPAAQVAVLGDLNDFYGGAAVSALQSATGLFHPYAWLPPLDRYSYLFNGAAQVLDHVLVTPNLAAQLALVQILHLHADAATGESPLAHSDHDPVVLRVRPGGAASIGGTLAWGEISVSVRDDDGLVMAHATTDARGDYRLWGLPEGMVMLQFDAPAWILLEEPIQLVDAGVGLRLASAPRVRHATAVTGAWVALSTPWLTDMLIPLN